MSNKFKDKKVLLCFEAFCDLDPSKQTNSIHNFYNTFVQANPGVTYYKIHHDEALAVYGKHMDEILPDFCEKHGIDIIIFILLGMAACNPSIDTYRKLKSRGIYLCFHWPDTGHKQCPWGHKTIEEIGDNADLHILWDQARGPHHDQIILPPNVLNLWVPQDPNFFYNESREQTIPYGFYGSTNYIDRSFFLRHVLTFVPDFHVRGGQRNENLSPYEYAALIRRTKINVNFSLSSANFFQIKGRAYEVLASNSLLLEYKNPATSTLFQPGADYIEFEQAKDLIDKLRYYVEHEEERKAIAQHGHATYLSKFTGNHFWHRITQKIEEDLHERRQA